MVLDEWTPDNGFVTVAFKIMYVDVLIRSVKREMFMSKKNFPVKFKTKCVWTLSPFSCHFQC